MTEPTTTQCIQWYRRILMGDCGVAGWGVREFFHLQRWQEQFPLTTLTDTRYMLWDSKVAGYPAVNPLALREFDPKTNVVISYFQSPWVVDYVARVSKMQTMRPATLQQMYHAIASGKDSGSHKVRPMAVKDWQLVGKKISSALNNYDARRGSQNLGAPKNYDRNLKLLGNYHWADCVAGIAHSIKPQPNSNKTVVLAGNSLCTGGAERQMINLAIGFAQQGWQAHSLSMMEDQDAPHYVALLQQHGIPMHKVLATHGADHALAIRTILASLPEAVRLAIWHLPIMLAMRIAFAVDFFLRTKPQLVVAYLDWPNVMTGLAAVLAGVPHVVLSGRNYHPGKFPHFYGWHLSEFHAIYQILTQLPQVQLTNNSRLGAASYAEWLKLPKAAVHFIPNCLTQEFMTSPQTSSLQQLRRQFNIKHDEKIILGVFRLAPEKRPQQFLAIVTKLTKIIPKLRVFICGIGMLQEQLNAYVIKHKLEKIVTFVGVTGEVRSWMNIADILLHVSEFEGMPNVMLEAQSQGLPIVCTRSGGVVDCLAPELLPYSFNNNDWQGVTAAAQKLLNNSALCKKLGTAAQRHARREFSIPRLVQHNLDIAGIAATRKKP